MLVGILYERRHTRLIADYGGIAHRMPVYSALFLLVALSSIGLPALNGFVGEFLILLGTFAVNPAYAAFAALGVILSAVYMLWMYQRAIFGEVTDPENEKLRDVNSRELAMLLPLAAMIVWMGVYSNTFLRPMDASIDKLMAQVQDRQVELAFEIEPWTWSIGNLSLDIPTPRLRVRSEMSAGSVVGRGHDR